MRRNLCLIAALLLCSCTVKENRSVCPCELLVRSDEPLKTEGNVLVSVIQNGVVVKQGMMGREDFDAGLCRLTVPRKPSKVTVFTGITGMNTVEGRRLDIRVQHQCDELYSDSVYAELTGDSQECLLTPHKNFARLNIIALGLPDDADVTVTGSVQGYDLCSTDPCEGRFGCAPDHQGQSADYNVRLPRQLDDALSMNVVVAGRRFCTVPIGVMIAATGYRFDDPDLLDISLTVDFSKSYVLVSIADWETAEYPITDF